MYVYMYIIYTVVYLVSDKDGNTINIISKKMYVFRKMICSLKDLQELKMKISHVIFFTSQSRD